ncbi:MAG TPA: hypothetical protein VKR06_43825 [Ktedonosporobacter sp.]|nr:hypothetical protein [Ktedonosporobacter sp.]
MTSTELEHAEKRMQQKWYDLVAAEQQGASVQALERLYNAYILAVEEYNRCSDEYQREHQSQPIPVTAVKRSGATSPSSPARHERKKRAS